MANRAWMAVLALGALCAQPVVAQQADTPDVAAQWRELLAHGTIESTNAAIETIKALGYTIDGVDADKCREHAADLARALRDVPVSMLVQHAAMRCAEVTGDEPGAERASRSLASLARDAFAQASRGAWPKPVRIVFPDDAYALFSSAGMTVRYELYADVRAKPYFPWMVAATPRGGGLEKLITFDFIDTLQTLDRKAEEYGTPRLRLGYVNTFVQTEAERGELRGVDLKAVLEAAQVVQPREKIAAIRDAAAQGGINAATVWLVVCAKKPYPECADGLVDALLPQAEQRHAYPMALLALAYLEGVGVPADQKAAEAMLDAADRVSEQRGATPAFMDIYGLIHPGEPLPAFLRLRLEASSEAGNAAAGVDLVVFDMRARGKDYVLSAADEARLADPANNGSGRGLLTLSQWYDGRDKGKSEAYLKQAAAADNPEALRVLAYRLREAQGSAPPSAEALALFERAANAGDAGAMLYRSLLAWMEGSPRRAEDWVLPAAWANNPDALLFLAGLWSAGYENMSETPEQAVKIYENLMTVEGYGARARRALAQLALEGKGVEKNPQRARALLMQDAEAGDAESQGLLGSALLSGRFGNSEEAAGREWMERAVAGGSTDAMGSYGSWLINEGTRPGDPEKGLMLSRKAADLGSESGLNNAAWYLCVTPRENLRDPVAGLSYAKKLEARPEISPAVIDTIAACEAASGHYVRAVELQQRVVAEVLRWPKQDQGSLEEMRARLALYQAGKPYIEEAKPRDEH